MCPGAQMEAEVFTFAVDTDTHKLVAVQQRGRSIDITVRYEADVVLDETRTRIRNAVEPRFQTDKVGLVIEWRQTIIPWVGWPTMVRRRRF